jgi:hypothetical protein
MKNTWQAKDICTVFLRLALGTTFFSAVADRFGIWGPLGTPNVWLGRLFPFHLLHGEVNLDLASLMGTGVGVDSHDSGNHTCYITHHRIANPTRGIFQRHHARRIRAVYGIWHGSAGSV